MELTKIRNLSDEELKHQEKTSADQLFRIRFQVALGQTDGVKKLRQLRKEIAQIKTVARERELGIHGETGEEKQSAAPAELKAHKTAEAVPQAEATAGAPKTQQAAPARTKAAKAKKTSTKPAAKAKAATTKKVAAGAKKKTGKAKRASK